MLQIRKSKINRCATCNGSHSCLAHVADALQPAACLARLQSACSSAKAARNSAGASGKHWIAFGAADFIMLLMGMQGCRDRTHFGQSKAGRQNSSPHGHWPWHGSRGRPYALDGRIVGQIAKQSSLYSGDDLDVSRNCKQAKSASMPPDLKYVHRRP